MEYIPEADTDGDGEITAMEEYAWENDHTTINEDGSVSSNLAAHEATEEWSGDEVEADVAAGEAVEAGLISSDTRQALTDQFASNDTGIGDSGENTTADKVESKLESATEQVTTTEQATTPGTNGQAVIGQAAGTIPSMGQTEMLAVGAAAAAVAYFAAGGGA
ncbi:hypothetical protein ACFR9U_17210 [Halorientalis brevis]|uniref:EF-hand domain-containing protein n=1 Tax=Halorientalis brevis TaxID=1126241 RepID=A0ABD6CEP6_9EURY|nr:hypothetical protein [Halorientalis brevis]